MEREAKIKLGRIIASAGMLGIAYLVSSSVQPLWQQLLIYLPAYLVAGYDVVLEAFESIREGEVFSEDLLMSIATIGALIIGFVPNGSPMFPERAV